MDQDPQSEEAVPYVPEAVFVYSEESEYLLNDIVNNPQGVNISPLDHADLLREPRTVLTGSSHVVAAGPRELINNILQLARTVGFSVGLIPLKKQKGIARAAALPPDFDAALDLALRAAAPAVDCVECNGHLVLGKATIGWIPMLDEPAGLRPGRILRKAVWKLFRLRLDKYLFETAGGSTIRTAASGCMILPRLEGGPATRIVEPDSSIRDVAVNLLVTSPFSVMEYLKFLVQFLWPGAKGRRLPEGVGYLKSRRLVVEPDIEMDVFIDGERKTVTPVTCELIPEAVKLNVGESLREELRKPLLEKETIRIDNLPDENELVKLAHKHIPLFSYASEQRFRDLFTSLRADSRTTSAYVVLMLVSVMLATLGLYLNSASVIIGAMLLAPLMNPMISFSMGILRSDEGLVKYSARTIILGIALALLASALVTQMFSDKAITEEMRSRLNPTLLDLGVAILSGVAAAYSKSFREIIQSLAGVAIAVALVPPLAVAGIGIGRLDYVFFSQAFLLFATNLVGITIAAILTFRVLGYSPVVRSRKGLLIILLFLAVIMVPLYLSYHRIVEIRSFEKRLKTERYLVNDKYIIIRQARLSMQGNKRVVLMKILARESLSRDDLNQLKQKIQSQFGTRLTIQTEVIYIL
ncbi:MAG TPA: DUF389 domain-containing protein [Chromatiales bacterium]|nr:DUF389 domain-containing protein [Chromatiales bacterium]